MFAQWGPSRAPQKANDCLLPYLPEGRSKVTDFFGKSQVLKVAVNHIFRNFVMAFCIFLTLFCFLDPQRANNCLMYPSNQGAYNSTRAKNYKIYSRWVNEGKNYRVI